MGDVLTLNFAAKSLGSPPHLCPRVFQMWASSTSAHPVFCPLESPLSFVLSLLSRIRLYVAILQSHFSPFHTSSFPESAFLDHCSNPAFLMVVRSIRNSWGSTCCFLGPTPRWFWCSWFGVKPGLCGFRASPVIPVCCLKGPGLQVSFTCFSYSMLSSFIFAHYYKERAEARVIA